MYSGFVSVGAVTCNVTISLIITVTVRLTISELDTIFIFIMSFWLR